MKRRKDGRGAYARAVCAIALTLIVSACNAPPNVVIVLTDDMGYGDVGAYGHPLIKTPHIDGLAANGQRWTSFYSAAPLCNPSRIALMTGRMPARVHGTGLNRWGNLPANELTLGQLMKERGFQTAYIGKWGMSGRFADGGVHPNDAGFDYFFGVEDFNDGGMLPDLPKTYATFKNAKSEYFRFDLFQQREAIENPVQQDTLTQRYTAEALRWLDEVDADEPFLLFLGHTMPHVPIFPSDAFSGRSLAGRYGDVIEEIDWSLGELTTKLDELGVRDNTLVIFTSDNGPWRTYYDLGGSPGPFRDGKHTAWEGGFRVPAIFSWPARIEPAVIDGMASQVDLLATIATLVGIDLPDDRPYDSIDFSATLVGGAAALRETWFFHARQGNVWAARQGRYKLVLESWDSIAKEGEPNEWRGFGNHVRHDPPLLFDLSTDLREELDIADEYPEIVASITSAIEDYEASLRIDID